MAWKLSAVGLSSLELRDVVTVPSVLTDYAVPGVAWSPMATAFAGVIGIALVYGVTSDCGFQPSSS